MERKPKKTLKPIVHLIRTSGRIKSSASKAKITKRPKEKISDQPNIPIGVIPIRPTNAMKDQFDLHQLDFGRPVKVVRKIDIVRFIKSQDDHELIEILEEIESGTCMEEVMVVRDPVNTYGTNYYLAVNEQNIQDLKIKHRMVAGMNHINTEHISDSPKGWKSLGSEPEVDDLTVTHARPLLCFIYERNAKFFNKPTHFSDISFELEFPSFNGASEVSIKADKSTTTTVESVATGVNTEVKLRANRAIQYEPQTLTEEQIQKHLKHGRLAGFLNKILPELEDMMDENSLVNVLTDDFASLKALAKTQPDKNVDK